MIEFKREYFQKSRIFLFPLLRFINCKYTSGVQTFISWENKFTCNDRKLVCVFDTSVKDFLAFERDIIMREKHFENVYTFSGGRNAHVFNLIDYTIDWEHFLNGRYSKLSLRTKQCIKNYIRVGSTEWEYVDSILYPDKYFQMYAEHLFDEKTYADGLAELKKVGELCNKPDLIKETLNTTEIIIPLVFPN